MVGDGEWSAIARELHSAAAAAKVATATETIRTNRMLRRGSQRLNGFGFVSFAVFYFF